LVGAPRKKKRKKINEGCVEETGAEGTVRKKGLSQRKAAKNKYRKVRLREKSKGRKAGIVARGNPKKGGFKEGKFQKKNRKDFQKKGKG